MTARVHHKCRNFNDIGGVCKITRQPQKYWGDACGEYDLKYEYKFLYRGPHETGDKQNSELGGFGSQHGN